MGWTRRSALAGLGCLAASAPAWAQGGGGENPGAALALLLLLPVVAAVLQLLLAAVWPQAVERLSGAAQTRREATVGWGVLGTVLLAMVLTLLAAVGQQAGQFLAALILIPVTIVVYACIAGVSSLVGGWCLRRDGREDQPTFLKVLIGSLVIALISWVPLFGTLLWVALTVFAAGSLIRATVGRPAVDASPTQPVEEAPS